MQKQINIKQAMDLLELPMSTVQPLLDCLHGRADQAQPLLTKFKVTCRKQRRRLAKKYHPDKTKDDGKRMAVINNLVDQILESKIIIRKPPPVVHYYYYAGTGTMNNYSTTTSYSGS